MHRTRPAALLSPWVIALRASLAGGRGSVMLRNEGTSATPATRRNMQSYPLLFTTLINNSLSCYYSELLVINLSGPTRQAYRGLPISGSDGGIWFQSEHGQTASHSTSRRHCSFYESDDFRRVPGKRLNLA